MNNVNLVISDIAAPQETYFENLHSGQCKLLCAKTFLYITSLVIVLAVQIGLFKIDVSELITNNNLQRSAIADLMCSFEFITVTILLDLLIQYIFSTLNAKFPHATMLGVLYTSHQLPDLHNSINIFSNANDSDLCES